MRNNAIHAHLKCFDSLALRFGRLLHCVIALGVAIANMVSYVELEAGDWSVALSISAEKFNFTGLIQWFITVEED